MSGITPQEVKHVLAELRRRAQRRDRLIEGMFIAALLGIGLVLAALMYW